MQSSNYRKYQTANPVVRRLIDGFYAQLAELVSAVDPGSVLDAGCGEGETLARLGDLLPERAVGIDVSPEAIEIARSRHPTAELRCESVYELPFADGEFDLVLCLEVLEHLEDPGAAVAELARVSAGAVIVSVPHEPWFRLGSVLRGKYLTTLGNHPEHVNHWNPRTLPRLLAPRLEVVTVARAFPWLLARCRVPAARASAPALR